MSLLPALHVEGTAVARLALLRLRGTCNRDEAAELLGISLKTFDNWRGRGIVPPPILGTTRWSVRQLLGRLDGAMDMENVESGTALDAWKRSRGED